MLIKNQKMDEVNPENINIIKKIIDDFEQTARGQKQRRRGRSCKISQSDSLIHRYRRWVGGRGRPERPGVGGFGFN